MECKKRENMNRILFIAHYKVAFYMSFEVSRII